MSRPAGGHVGGDQQVGGARRAAGPSPGRAAPGSSRRAAPRPGSPGRSASRSAGPPPRGCGRRRSPRWATPRPAPGPARPACAPAPRCTRSAGPGAPRRPPAAPGRSGSGPGRVRCWRAIPSMRDGMVAEKSTVCRCAGACSRIASMSSAKPMSSISSASSSTTVARPPSRSVPRAMWSRARPGVATTTSTPRVQGPQLPADRLPAVDRQHPGAQVLAVAVDRLGHLHRQLPGRHQHQRHRVARRRGRRHPLQQRQRERGRLARAGGRLAEQVLPVQQRRDRLPLDRGRLLVAEGGQRAQQLGAQPEIREGARLVGADGGGVGRCVVPCGCGTHAPSFSSRRRTRCGDRHTPAGSPAAPVPAAGPDPGPPTRRRPDPARPSSAPGGEDGQDHGDPDAPRRARRTTRRSRAAPPDRCGGGPRPSRRAPASRRPPATRRPGRRRPPRPAPAPPSRPARPAAWPAPPVRAACRRATPISR